MINHSSHLLLFFCLLLIVSVMPLFAQDAERKWSVSYLASPFIRPVFTKNTGSQSPGRGFKGFSIMGEYYLPKKWTVEAGYFRTEVSYRVNGRTMEGIQLGIKRYLINRPFFIQPYVTGAAQFNWGKHIETSHHIQENYLDAQYTKNPIFSFTPGAGADIFLFSSIAFVLKYNFNIGFNSKTVIDVMPERGDPYTLKDFGLLHHLQLGFKVTFPVRTSKKTVRDAYDILLDVIDNELVKSISNK